MHFNTDDSASYELHGAVLEINKTNMKYFALTCIVNGQIRPNVGVRMQDAQRLPRFGGRYASKPVQVAERDDRNYDWQ